MTTHGCVFWVPCPHCGFSSGTSGYCLNCGTLYDEITSSASGLDIPEYLSHRFNALLHTRFRKIYAFFTQGWKFLSLPLSHMMCTGPSDSPILESLRQEQISASIDWNRKTLIRRAEAAAHRQDPAELKYLESQGLRWKEGHVILDAKVYRIGTDVTFSAKELRTGTLVQEIHDFIPDTPSALEAYAARAETDSLNHRAAADRHREAYEISVLSDLAPSDSTQVQTMVRMCREYFASGTQRVPVLCAKAYCGGYLVTRNCMVCGHGQGEKLQVKKIRCVGCGSSYEVHQRHSNMSRCQWCLGIQDARLPEMQVSKRWDLSPREYYQDLFGLPPGDLPPFRALEYEEGVLACYLYANSAPHDLVMFWCRCLGLAKAARIRQASMAGKETAYDAEEKNLADEYLLGGATRSRVEESLVSRYRDIKEIVHVREILGVLSQSLAGILEGAIASRDLEGPAIQACQTIQTARNALYTAFRMYRKRCLVIINTELEFVLFRTLVDLPGATLKLPPKEVRWMYKHYSACMHLGGMVTLRHLRNEDSSIRVALVNILDKTQPYSVRVPPEIKNKLPRMYDYVRRLGPHLAWKPQ